MSALLATNGNGRAGVAIAILLIFSGLSLFNNLCAKWKRNDRTGTSLRPVGGSQN